jgi:hypothetical protein
MYFFLLSHMTLNTFLGLKEQQEVGNRFNHCCYSFRQKMIDFVPFRHF